MTAPTPPRRAAKGPSLLPTLLPLCCLAAALIASKRIGPTLDERRTAKERELATLRASLTTMQQLSVGEVHRRRDSLTAERNRLDARESVMPVSPSAAPLLRLLERQARARGVEILKLAPEPVDAQVGALTTPYTPLAVAAELRGPWASVVSVLRDLAGAPTPAIPIVHSLASDTTRRITTKASLLLVGRGTVSLPVVRRLATAEVPGAPGAVPGPLAPNAMPNGVPNVAPPNLAPPVGAAAGASRMPPVPMPAPVGGAAMTAPATMGDPAPAAVAAVRAAAAATAQASAEASASQRGATAGPVGAPPMPMPPRAVPMAPLPPRPDR